MTFVVTWGHVGVLAGVLTLLGSLIGWLINRFDRAQDAARAELLQKIDDRNKEQDAARLALREALNEKHVQQFKEASEIRKSLEASWVKIDKLMEESVARDEIERMRADNMVSNERLRTEFREEIDRLGTRVETAINNLGARLDAAIKSDR